MRCCCPIMRSCVTAARAWTWLARSAATSPRNCRPVFEKRDAPAPKQGRWGRAGSPAIHVGAPALRGHRLAHPCHLVRFDLVEDAYFARASVGIHGVARVLEREPVDLRVGTGLGDLDDAAAHLEVAVGVVGILDREGDARITAHVAVL